MHSYEIDKINSCLEEKKALIKTFLHEKKINSLTMENLNKIMVTHTFEDYEIQLVLGLQGTGKTTYVLDRYVRKYYDFSQAMYLCYNRRLKDTVNLKQEYGKIYRKETEGQEYITREVDEGQEGKKWIEEKKQYKTISKATTLHSFIYKILNAFSYDSYRKLKSLPPGTKHPDNYAINRFTNLDYKLILINFIILMNYFPKWCKLKAGDFLSLTEVLIIDEINDFDSLKLEALKRIILLKKMDIVLVGDFLQKI